MIKDNQLIDISITPAVFEWYFALGYQIKMWDKIKVPPEDLPPTSHHKIKVICIKCGQEKEIQYRYYLNHKKNYGGEYHCPLCTAHLTEVQKKREENLQKAMLEKYGVIYSVQIPGVMEKMKKTCQERYGVDYSTQSSLMKEKSRNTLERLGKVRTSKQQLSLYKMLKQEFSQIKINVSLGPYNLDCELIIDEIKIDIEYDGAFWHQKTSRDRRRDGFVKKNGYKILRVKGGVGVPSIDELKEKIDILLQTQNKYEEIILPEWEKFFKKNH